MDHVENVYTAGTTESGGERTLREGKTVALALADGGNAHAVPVDYHYDGEAIDEIEVGVYAFESRELTARRTAT